MSGVCLFIFASFISIFVFLWPVLHMKDVTKRFFTCLVKILHACFVSTNEVVVLSFRFLFVVLYFYF